MIGVAHEWMIKLNYRIVLLDSASICQILREVESAHQAHHLIHIITLLLQMTVDLLRVCLFLSTNCDWCAEIRAASFANVCLLHANTTSRAHAQSSTFHDTSAHSKPRFLSNLQPCHHNEDDLAITTQPDEGHTEGETAHDGIHR